MQEVALEPIGSEQNWNFLIEQKTKTIMYTGRYTDGLLGNQRDAVLPLITESGLVIDPKSNESQLVAGILNGTIYKTQNGEHQIHITPIDIQENSERLGSELAKRNQSLAVIPAAYDNTPAGALYGALGTVVARRYLLEQLSQKPGALTDEHISLAMEHANNAVLAVSKKTNITISPMGMAVAVYTTEPGADPKLMTATMGNWVGVAIDESSGNTVSRILSAMPEHAFGTEHIDTTNSGSISVSRWNMLKPYQSALLYGGKWKADEYTENTEATAFQFIEDHMSPAKIAQESLRAMMDEHTQGLLVRCVDEKSTKEHANEVEEKKPFYFDTAEVPLSLLETGNTQEQVKDGMKVLGTSETGKVRDHNEDAFLTHESFDLPIPLEITEEPPDGKKKGLNLVDALFACGIVDPDGKPYTAERITHVFDAFKQLKQQGNIRSLGLVADGMGGHPDGEVASSLAIFASAKYLTETLGGKEPATGTVMDTVLLNTVKTVHNTLTAYKTSEQGTDAGATFALAIEDANGETHVANVGDTRIYKIDMKNTAHLLTHDNTWIWDHIRETGPSGVFNNPQRNILRFGLPLKKVDNMKNISTGTVTLEKDERLVLCSDGCWEDFAREGNEQLMDQVDGMYKQKVKKGVNPQDAAMDAMGTILTHTLLKPLHQHESVLQPRQKLLRWMRPLFHKEEVFPAGRSFLMNLLITPDAGKYSQDNNSVVIMEKDS